MKMSVRKMDSGDRSGENKVGYFKAAYFKSENSFYGLKGKTTTLVN